MDNPWTLTTLPFGKTYFHGLCRFPGGHLIPWFLWIPFRKSWRWNHPQTSSPPALIDIKRHTCRDWVVSGTHMAAISCIQTSAMSCCNQPARSKVTGPTGWWWPSSHTIQHKNTGDILKFLKQPMSSEVRPRSKVGRHAVVLGRLALSTQGKGYGNLWLWSLLCQHCHSWLSGGFRVTSAQWCKCPASTRTNIVHIFKSSSMLSYTGSAKKTLAKHPFFYLMLDFDLSIARLNISSTTRVLRAWFRTQVPTATPRLRC